jgi:hypothetical protein
VNIIAANGSQGITQALTTQSVVTKPLNYTRWRMPLMSVPKKLAENVQVRCSLKPRTVQARMTRGGMTFEFNTYPRLLTFKNITQYLLIHLQSQLSGKASNDLHHPLFGI